MNQKKKKKTASVGISSKLLAIIKLQCALYDYIFQTISFRGILEPLIYSNYVLQQTVWRIWFAVLWKINRVKIETVMQLI